MKKITKILAIILIFLSSISIWYAENKVEKSINNFVYKLEKKYPENEKRIEKLEKIMDRLEVLKEDFQRKNKTAWVSLVKDIMKLIAEKIDYYKTKQENPEDEIIKIFDIEEDDIEESFLEKELKKAKITFNWISFYLNIPWELLKETKCKIFIDWNDMGYCYGNSFVVNSSMNLEKWTHKLIWKIYDDQGLEVKKEKKFYLNDFTELSSRKNKNIDYENWIIKWQKDGTISAVRIIDIKSGDSIFYYRDDEKRGLLDLNKIEVENLETHGVEALRDGKYKIIITNHAKEWNNKFEINYTRKK